MQFAITILGCGAAIPVTDRNPTSQLVEAGGQVLLLDCGEGTQMQLRRFSKKGQRIGHIFISHMHGDHYFGLIGLINSFHLMGRTNELHLYGIGPVREIIELQLRHSRTELNYPLVFHEIDPGKTGIILNDSRISVSTLPMNHRVPTCGFLIREKPGRRKVRNDFIRLFPGLESRYEEIKNGADFIDDTGMVHVNRLITDDPAPQRCYAYCSDTAYDESIAEMVRGSDLLYHEATFTSERQADARAKYHSTAAEAAWIARKGEVKKLMIGHFSARYKDLSVLLEEARAVFPDTILAEDGLRTEL
jgi:ribonuclease Z